MSESVASVAASDWLQLSRPEERRMAEQESVTFLRASPAPVGDQFGRDGRGCRAKGRGRGTGQQHPGTRGSVRTPQRPRGLRMARSVVQCLLTRRRPVYFRQRCGYQPPAILKPVHSKDLLVVEPV